MTIMEAPVATDHRETIVVVDDEPSLLGSLRRSLAPNFEVATFEAAEQALERVRDGGVSVVLSDVAMPGMTGLDLATAVRQHDPDLPVLLMTGLPTLEGATKAMERGVHRYLQKPFEVEEVMHHLQQASQLHRSARLRREAFEQREPRSEEPLLGGTRFKEVLGSIWVAFQPIVSVSKRNVFGYEALVRSTHPDFISPAQLLDSAERLRTVEELGRLVRRRASDGLRDASDDALLFVNLHARDLVDPELLDRTSPLSAIASRVVLEITERAPLEGSENVSQRIQALRAMGFRIAIDDLGAGYAGLTSFALLEPDIVKVDMSLTRGIDRSRLKRKLISSLASVCQDTGVTLIVEGVETTFERDTLLEAGCDLMQGHLFARPARSLPRPTW